MFQVKNSEEESSEGSGFEMIRDLNKSKQSSAATNEKSSNKKESTATSAAAASNKNKKPAGKGPKKGKKKKISEKSEGADGSNKKSKDSSEPKSVKSDEAKKSEKSVAPEQLFFSDEDESSGNDDPVIFKPLQKHRSSYTYFVLTFPKTVPFLIKGALITCFSNRFLKWQNVMVPYHIREHNIK